MKPVDTKAKHRRKMIAPIFIGGLLALYYIGFAAFCVTADEIPLWGKWLMGIVPLALAGACIAMLIERIKEIRSGEEDDLSQY